MVGGRRLVAARVVAGLAAAFYALPWFGLIDLSTVVEQDAQFHDNYLLESGWGLLFLVLVAVPFTVLVRRPGARDALAQLVVVGAALLVGAVWRSTPSGILDAIGLLVATGVLGVLGGARAPRWTRPDVPLVMLAVLALPGAVLYAAPLIENTTVKEDNTNGLSHWPVQASLALALVALIALASVVPSRLPAWTSALCALWLGVESLVYPGLRASLGTAGGALTVGWGLLVILATELALRRQPRPRPELTD